jgi:hypothetical protein
MGGCEAMSTKNDITGDSLVSKASTESYRNNFDNIFGKKKEQPMIDDDNENIEEHDEDQEYDDTCTWCGGCGEGDYDGAACRRCHGTGVEPIDGVDDDYV